MQDRKNIHSPGYCSNIRNFYQAARERFDKLEAEYQRAGQRVDETQKPFLGKIDPAQEPQLRIEADEALREARRLKSELARQKRQLDSYKNDYVLSGCEGLIGSL